MNLAVIKRINYSSLPDTDKARKWREKYHKNTYSYDHVTVCKVWSRLRYFWAQTLPFAYVFKCWQYIHLALLEQLTSKYLEIKLLQLYNQNDLQKQFLINAYTVALKIISWMIKVACHYKIAKLYIIYTSLKTVF